MRLPDRNLEAFEALGKHADSPAKLRELGLKLGDVGPWPLRRRKNALRGAAWGHRLIPLPVPLRAVRSLTPGLIGVASLAWRLSASGLVTIPSLAWWLPLSIGFPFAAGFGFEFLHLVSGHFAELVGLAFHACGLQAFSGLENLVNPFPLSADGFGLVGIGFLGKRGDTAECGS